jgi:hypothetical protein
VAEKERLVTTVCETLLTLLLTLSYLFDATLHKRTSIGVELVTKPSLVFLDGACTYLALIHSIHTLI